MPRIDKRGRIRRAYTAYVDLLDAADALRERMSRQLRTWNLTILQYRVLDALYHEGPQYQQALSRKFHCSKQNAALVIRGLEECGCIERVAARLPL